MTLVVVVSGPDRKGELRTTAEVIRAVRADCMPKADVLATARSWNYRRKEDCGADTGVRQAILTVHLTLDELSGRSCDVSRRRTDRRCTDTLDFRWIISVFSTIAKLIKAPESSWVH